MSEANINSSEALKKERLKSDRIRVIAMLVVLCLLFSSTLLRAMTFAGEVERQALPLFIIYFVCMVGFESAMLGRIGHALRLNSDLSRAARKFGAAEVISSLYAAVTAFASGTAQQDDLTAVVLKRLR